MELVPKMMKLKFGTGSKFHNGTQLQKKTTAMRLFYMEQVQLNSYLISKFK